MIYWIVFFAISVVSLSQIVQRQKQLDLLIYYYIYFFLLYLVGFKYASIDYFGYEELYYSTPFSDFSIPFFTTNLGTTGMEFVWATFSSLFNQIGFSFAVWVFFIALVSITIKFYFFKKLTPYFLVSIAIYLTASFIKDMGQLRNGLASAVLMFSIYPIINRNFSKFLLVVLIAFGVQAYAIIALPLYWAYPFFKRLRFSLMFVLSALCLVSAIGGISEILLSMFNKASFVPAGVIHKVEGYTSEELEIVSIFTITGSAFVLIAFAVVFFKERIISKSEVLTVFSMFHFYGVSLFLLFTGINTVTSRSLDLFSLTALPFLLIIPLYFTKGILRLFALAAVFAFCALRLYANAGAFFPYKNVLFS